MTGLRQLGVMMVAAGALLLAAILLRSAFRD